MNISFEGKVALVTGGASGIGLATVKAFAAAGASVVVADVNQQAAEAVVNALNIPGRAIAVKCDVSQEREVEAMVAEAVRAFGRVDCAFNSAGIHIPVSNTADGDLEQFERLMAINVRGTWLCMKHQLRQMEAQGEGSIVNCSSQSGLAAAPGLSPYVGSKHAVIGMTKATGLEYARRGIRVNVVCPGSTDTPMVATALADHPEAMQAAIDAIPLGRLGKAEEVASAVIWLSSPGAGFMIGQSVVPDGGYTVA